MGNEESASRNQDLSEFPALVELQDHLWDSEHKFRAYIMITMINKARLNDGKVMLGHTLPVATMYQHLTPYEKVMMFATLKNVLSELHEEIIEQISEETFNIMNAKACEELNPSWASENPTDEEIDPSQYQHIFDNKFDIEDINSEEDDNGQIR